MSKVGDESTGQTPIYTEKLIEESRDNEEIVSVTIAAISDNQLSDVFVHAIPTLLEALDLAAQVRPTSTKPSQFV